jgi:hypothetical protein
MSLPRPPRPLHQPSLFDPPPQLLRWEALPLASRQEALRILVLMLRGPERRPSDHRTGKGATHE